MPVSGYVPLPLSRSVYLVFARAALRYYIANHFNFTISLWRAHFTSIGGFCPGASPCTLWPALVPCGQPWDTHLPPFTHTLPPTRPFFNFYTLFPYFNFSPHFSATLPPLESTFYPRSRFYTLFTPLGASLFTYPFLHLFYRGRTLFTHFTPQGGNSRHYAETLLPSQRHYCPHRGIITLTEALLPIYPPGRPIATLRGDQYTNIPIYP